MRTLLAFDLDGVLYSSEPFLGAAYREAIAVVNARRPDAFPRVPGTREILDHVGWPVPVILARLFGDVEPAAVDLLYGETLRVICARVARGEGVLFAGVAPTLAALAAAGFGLTVASNGRRRYIETVLATYDLGRFFEALIAVDDRPAVADDKADVLRAYLSRHALSAAALVMVGDRASDVAAARAVGCRFIGCDYGHGHRAEIDGAGPVVSAFSDIPRILRERFALPNRPAAG